ncbi:hypothetical protein GWI33_016975 [Rhynchophorus ferrugineus]|uniref:Uncharacterized protein n=1 Tax=Rhynchophorus ferrugineus TaxID=354439 RepID=A0A834HZV0_RHYFE|nr:hypothetical protein GWI33_016975 [Rhynchophorus ferrugineus]
MTGVNRHHPPPYPVESRARLRFASRAHHLSKKKPAPIFSSQTNFPAERFPRVGLPTLLSEGRYDYVPLSDGGGLWLGLNGRLIFLVFPTTRLMTSGPFIHSNFRCLPASVSPLLLSVRQSLLAIGLGSSSKGRRLYHVKSRSPSPPHDTAARAPGVIVGTPH